MEDSLITVIAFNFPHELTMPRSLLESEGIECFVPDEYMSDTMPFRTNAMGGIRLQVRESDALRAYEILREAGYIKEEEPNALDRWLDKLHTGVRKIFGRKK